MILPTANLKQDYFLRELHLNNYAKKPTAINTSPAMEGVPSPTKSELKQ